MIGAAVFNDTNSTDRNLLADSVIQEEQAIGNVLLQAMASIKSLSWLSGNDRRNLFGLEPSEQPFNFYAKNTRIFQAGKERFNRV